jgi:hypothetical protein
MSNCHLSAPYHSTRRVAARPMTAAPAPLPAVVATAQDLTAGTVHPVPCSTTHMPPACAVRGATVRWRGCRPVHHTPRAVGAAGEGRPTTPPHPTPPQQRPRPPACSPHRQRRSRCRSGALHPTRRPQQAAAVWRAADHPCSHCTSRLHGWHATAAAAARHGEMRQPGMRMSVTGCQQTQQRPCLPLGRLHATGVCMVRQHLTSRQRHMDPMTTQPQPSWSPQCMAPKCVAPLRRATGAWGLHAAPGVLHWLLCSTQSFGPPLHHHVSSLTQVLGPQAHHWTALPGFCAHQSHLPFSMADLTEVPHNQPWPVGYSRQAPGPNHGAHRLTSLCGHQEHLTSPTRPWHGVKDPPFLTTSI